MAIRPTLKEFRDYISSQGSQMELAIQKAAGLRKDNRLYSITTAQDYTRYVDIQRDIKELDKVIKRHERNIRLAENFIKWFYPIRSGALKQLIRRRH